MNDQPDFAALARDYIDLWEDQLSSLAADPALAEQGARLLDTMSQLGNQVSPAASAQMAAMMQQFMTLTGAMGGGTPGYGTSTPGSAHRAAPEPPHGAAAAAAPSDDRDQQLAQLAGRLAALEERLDHLESGAGAARAKPRTTPRRAGTTDPKPKKPRKSR